MNISEIPGICGVYLMRDSSGDIIYIGKAKNLRKRISQYFLKSAAGKSHKTPNLVSLVRRIDYIPAESEREALILERRLINRVKPFFNSLWKDDKSYPMIKVTLYEDFPSLRFTRRIKKDGSLYFGPYPKAGSVRKLLRHLEKTHYLRLKKCRYSFSEKNPLPERKIKACVYYHTGECPAPCAGRTSRKEYSEFVKRIILFFRGDFRKLLKRFRREMKEYSENLEYEKAAERLSFIKAIEHLSEKVRVFKTMENEIPEYGSDAASELGKILKLPRLPLHIEGFDTSSLFARHACASCVCFVNGEKNASHYRRYRIKDAGKKRGSDDTRMMAEAVKRRLSGLMRRKEKPPDLILVDGGKSQLGAAIKAAKETGTEIPVISLAKREEEIFTSRSREPLKLPANSEALKLLQRIRDEAHRFALKYHRILRGKI